MEVSGFAWLTDCTKKLILSTIYEVYLKKNVNTTSFLYSQLSIFQGSAQFFCKYSRVYLTSLFGVRTRLYKQYSCGWVQLTRLWSLGAAAALPADRAASKVYVISYSSKTQDLEAIF